MTGSPEARRILVVDDDPRLVRLVREVLTAAGHEILVENSGERAIQAIAVEQPDLVLLDIMLKDMDGYKVARRTREFSDVPVIMLTAKVTETDMLAGFEAGADDYITKPFNSKELLARVRAVLKRTHKPPASAGGTVVCGDLSIDLARRRVRVGDRDVYLTATEYNLLYQMATHLDQVVLHEELLTQVWGPEYRGDLDYLRSYIHYLRKKLERDPSNPTMIVNIQGVGYMLAAPATAGGRRDA
ncbi:MAG: DNA-binding response regulator [Gammaproteobacteria bacterium RBG_16_66_13]|jgi:two-component system KDP operon response regulator KdpE|nr:MAG: DNA-binding response regulator [Gammaproteobacteria bacterium RBG_16_66_13]